MTKNEQTKTIIQNLGEISLCVSRLSSYINDPPHQKAILSNRKKWNMIVSSVWVLGDTELAISSYLSSEFPKETGNKYLAIYGLLQAMFLQQDATFHICEALGIHFEPAEPLLKVRRIRNISIGHPTKMEREKVFYFGYLSRPSLEKGSFDFIRSDTRRDSDDFVNVDTYSLLVDQTSEISQLLRNVANEVDHRREEHLNKHKKQKLVEYLPDTMSYEFEKMYQGIFSPGNSNAEFAVRMLGIVRRHYDEFVAELERRGELESTTRFDLVTYFRSLEALTEYLERKSDRLTQHDALIYAKYAQDQTDEFRKIAREIDDKYEGKG